MIICMDGKIMKTLITTLKTVFCLMLIMLLANCATTSHESQSTVEADESKIIVTGSRIKRTETEELVVVESPPVSPAPSQSAASTLEELLALVKQRKVNSKERSNNSQQGILSDTEKEQLYRTIAISPEAAGQIFKRYKVNPTIQTHHNPTSTFSMDVDNGSYKLASAMLNQNQLPNPDGIRVEEFVNSMEYQYHQSEDLFSVSAEAMPSPFRSGYHILHIGLQTKSLSDQERNPSNLVLVADTSGSMNSDNKLALLKNAMTTLVSQLNSDDKIALVVYNDTASIALPPTNVYHKRTIFNAINTLSAGGSTNAEHGLIKGYELAKKIYRPGYNNRVILTSDGMANVGSSSPKAILAKISESKDKGIFLTTLGVGRDMYNDHLLEQLANQGNGNYLYIANQKDIQQAFVDELNSQLQTVAKDAKIQVKFNSNLVSNYRLLGYENRHLNEQDFTDANKDGGEIGAGHKVTALYEIKLNTTNEINTQNIAKLSIAYKKPQGHKVRYIHKDIPSKVIKPTAQKASPDSRLSFAIAAFAEKLRQSYWARTYSYLAIENLLSSLPHSYQKQSQVKQLKQQVRTAFNIDNRDDLYESQHPISNINYDRVPLLD